MSQSIFIIYLINVNNLQINVIFVNYDVLEIT